MKKNFQRHALPAMLLVTVLVSSCYPGTYVPDPYIVDETRQRENIYYVPTAANTPLLTEKGDLSFDLMRASGSKFTGLEMQGAYLPWQHAGFTWSYSTGSNHHDNPNYMNYQQIEVGGGYVTKFAKGWHFENYAGWGNGRFRNSHYTGYSKIRVNHFFVQPTLAVSNPNQTLQFAFASKFSGANFSLRDTLFDTDREPFSTNQIKTLNEKPFHVMWEPALVFRAGWKNLLFNAQYSFSTDLTKPGFYREKNNFSIGVALRYNTNMK